MSQFFSGWSSLSSIAEQVSGVGQSIVASAQETAAFLSSEVENLSLEKVAEKIKLAPNEIKAEEEKIAREIGTGNAVVTLLPWETTIEEKSIMSQGLMEKISKLSLDESTFTTNPPEDSYFHFDLQSHIDMILRLLELDANLGKIQSSLGCKMNETTFWQNYFYKVSLLRKEAGLEPLVPNITTSTLQPDLPQDSCLPSPVPAERNVSSGAIQLSVSQAKVDTIVPVPVIQANAEAEKIEEKTLTITVSNPAEKIDTVSSPVQEVPEPASPDIADDFDFGSDMSDLEDGLIDADLEAEIAFELEEGDL